LSIKSPSYLCVVMLAKAHLQFVTHDKTYELTLNEMKDTASRYKLRSFIRVANFQLQFMKSTEDSLELKPIAAESQTQLSLEEEAAMIRSVAEMTRIDLEDDNDPVAQTINLGIRDLNPERILKFCEHLHILYRSVGGIFAEMYGLRSAGSKLVYCESKDKAVEGMEFDLILSLFKLQYCEGCKRQSSRPTNWIWSREWQRERQANMPEGLKSYLRQSH